MMSIPVNLSCTNTLKLDIAKWVRGSCNESKDRWLHVGNKVHTLNVYWCPSAHLSCLYLLMSTKFLSIFHVHRLWSWMLQSGPEVHATNRKTAYYILGTRPIHWMFIVAFLVWGVHRLTLPSSNCKCTPSKALKSQSEQKCTLQARCSTLLTHLMSEV